MKQRIKEKEGLFRNLVIAHIILLLHIFLLAGVGVTVVLFRGVYHYLPWIMGAIGVLILLIAGFFYRQMRSGTSDIQTILSMPVFQNRTVEIKLMGGLASFKLEAPKTTIVPLDHQISNGQAPALLEQKIQKTEESLYTLAALYEKDLITKEAFLQAKQALIQG
ncbi:MAG: SHOCT domain-containing protein [Pseudomonadota bacterium]